LSSAFFLPLPLIWGRIAGINRWPHRALQDRRNFLDHILFLVDMFKNLAFISYSRLADGALAAKLQKELERYAIPLGLQCDRSVLQRNKYMRPVFRDHTDLNLHSPSWDAQLTDELQQSRYLLVVCSPAAAASLNINREVQTFLEAHENDVSRVLPIIASGDLTATAGPTRCLPPALEPHRPALLTRNLPLARDCVGPELMLKVAAWLLRVEYSGLYSQFRHQRTRQRRLTAAMATSIVAILSFLGWKVWSQREENQTLAVEKQRQEQIATDETANAARKTYLAKIRQAARAIGQNQLGSARQALTECAVGLREWEWRYLYGQLDQALRVLAIADAHTPVAFAKDAKRLAVLTPERTVEVLEIQDFSVLRQIQPGLAKLDVVALSPNGRWLAVAASGENADDGQVVVWDAETGKEAWRVKTSFVLSLKFANNNQMLFVSAPNYGGIQQFDAATGTAGKVLGMAGNLAGRFALSATAEQLAAIDYDGRRVLLFSTADGKELWRQHVSDLAGSGSFRDVDISPGGKQVLVGANTGVWLIDAESGIPKQKLSSGTGQVKFCRFSPGAASIAVVSVTGAVEVHQYFELPGTTKPLRSFAPHSGKAAEFAFCSESEFLVGGIDGSVRSQFFHIAAAAEGYQGHLAEIHGILGLPDLPPPATGARADFVTWSRDHTARFWSLERTATPVGQNQITEDHLKTTHALSTPSNDEKSWVVRQTHQGGSKLVTPVKEISLVNDGSWVRGAVFSADSQRLISTLAHTAKIWNTTQASLVTELTGHRDEVLAVDLNQQGTIALTGSADRTVRVWNGVTGQSQKVLQTHQAPVKFVRLSPDGKLAASGDEQGVVIVWNLADGSQRHVLRGHQKPIHVLSFSSKSDRLLTGTREEPLHVWDLATGQSLGQLEVTGLTAGACFGHVDARILTVSDDGLLSVWDARHLELVVEFPLPTHQAITLQCVTADSSVLVTDIAGPTIRLAAAQPVIPQRKPQPPQQAVAAPPLKSAPSNPVPAKVPLANVPPQIAAKTPRSDKEPTAPAPASKTPPAKVLPPTAEPTSSGQAPDASPFEPMLRSAETAPDSSTEPPAKPVPPPPKKRTAPAPRRPTVPPESDKPAEKLPAEHASLREVLLNYQWHYFDNLFPPGDMCRFNDDGTWHVWKWKYWIVGPREIRVHYNKKENNPETGIKLEFSENLESFSGEFTDSKGKVHVIKGTRREKK
jgi:WD40 repeat protein